MGNDKNKKKQGPKNSRGKTRLAVMSTSKQKPTYPCTHSITYAQHTQTTLLATPMILDDDEPQEVPNLLTDVTTVSI